MARWRDLLERIRRGRSGSASDAEITSDEAPPQSTLEINLGIDFGTSYTKVCFRDSGAEQSGIVRLGANGGAIIPSVVCIGARGELVMKHRGSPCTSHTEIRFLKMCLAGVSIDERKPPAGLAAAATDLGCRALSAWFLAQVILESRGYLLEAEANRFINRDVVWSANLGVPVEHYDAPAVDVFNEVLAVAWKWAGQAQMPDSLATCIGAYESDQKLVDASASDCHAVPEIAAAVQSFVISRSAIPGFYVYFDIGGGTVDGVAFNFLNREGSKQINFYSGKVCPIGMSVFKQRKDNIKKDLQRLVGYVITMARQKDKRDWRKVNVQEGTRRRILGALNPQDVLPLIVFLGGYGAEHSWYRKNIVATYRDFNHHASGIPPYQLSVVPAPGDLRLGEGDEYPRFAIAYGLSIGKGEGPKSVCRVRLKPEIYRGERAEERS